MNKIKNPSTIRVEADEVTYPLHIILRCVLGSCMAARQLPYGMANIWCCSKKWGEAVLLPRFANVNPLPLLPRPHTAKGGHPTCSISDTCNSTKCEFLRICICELLRMFTTMASLPFRRYELERGLVDGTIEVDDLPKLWNQKMQEYLGHEPESDAKGVLQDVHWSAGWVAPGMVCSLECSARGLAVGCALGRGVGGTRHLLFPGVQCQGLAAGPVLNHGVGGEGQLLLHCEAGVGLEDGATEADDKPRSNEKE